MTKDSMFGALVMKIADLSSGKLEVVYDLVEKLSGEAGQQWFAELKNFRRKENCWTDTDIVKETFLRLISSDESLILDECDGSEIIADAKSMFTGGIDSDFIRGADEKGKATGAMPVDVYGMIMSATFSQMFGELSADIKKLCLTQHQIKNFVKKYRNWLRTNGHATFFLFESKGRFFITRVSFSSDGRLEADIYRFEFGHVWSAGGRHRIVIPQVA